MINSVHDYAEGMRIPKPWNQPIQQGRLLLLSIFDQHIHRATKETAHQRNLLVAALAKEHVFIHIEPGGETEKVAKSITTKYKSYFFDSKYRS